MPLGTKAYDPAMYIATFGGVEIKGYAPGAKIAGTFPALFNMVVGLDGEVARGKTNDKTSQWRFSLLQTSVSNRVFSNNLAADDAAPSGIVLPFFLKNVNGDTLITSPSAWVVGPPELSLAAEVGVNEWTIQCGETITYIGGQDSLV